MQGVCKSPNFFEVTEQEAKLFELLEGDVFEVDGADVLPDAVGEELVHHAVDIGHAAHVISKLFEKVGVSIQIIYCIQSLIDLVHVY